MEELKLLCVVSGISCYEYAGGRNNLWGMWMEGSHVTRAWEEVSRSYPWFSQIQNQRASREGKYFWQKQTKEQRGSNTAFPWSKRRKSRKAIFSARMTKSSFLVRETFYNFLTRDTLAYIQSSFISIVFSLIFMHCGNNCALFNWAKTKLDKDYESYLYSIYLNAWVYVIANPHSRGRKSEIHFDCFAKERCLHFSHSFRWCFNSTLSSPPAPIAYASTRLSFLESLIIPTSSICEQYHR